MRMLYNQRKKLHKDALFSATVKRNFKLKRFTCIMFSSFHIILRFEQRRLLRECIETRTPKTHAFCGMFLKPF